MRFRDVHAKDAGGLEGLDERTWKLALAFDFRRERRYRRSKFADLLERIDHARSPRRRSRYK
jgi:hypothetical protein